MPSLRPGLLLLFFRYRIPTMVRDEIDAIEKELWERVNESLMEDIWEEVEEWVMDPSTTVGRLSSYECLIITYCFMKNLMPM